MAKPRKQNKHHSQKMYKMRGCSKKKTRRNHRGGDTLAYPSSNVPKVPNPFLAYNGRGGKSCGITPQPSNLAYDNNRNGANPLHPSTGPAPDGFNFLNSQTKRGGCGGSCGLLQGGSGPHRKGCRCSDCKSTYTMSGGASCGNNGIPYPDGTAGTSWTPNSSGWPASPGLLPGDANHFSLNTYNNDISRQMVDIGAAPPFTGGKRGKRTLKKRRSQRGGILSNLISQDFVNLGRQLQYGVGSAYNGLLGYQSPVNPLPWKGQLANTPSLSSIRNSI
jgi:hypothetical protein